MTNAVDDVLLDSNVLGRYRILCKLASGGMGSVYLARTEGAEGFTRPVVVKRVLPSLMNDREVAQLFVQEARILSNFRHQSIVSVLDFGQQTDGAYLTVLEYVNGYALDLWFDFAKRERGGIPADFAFHIVIHVLDALHYAHTFQRGDGRAMKIIHRDVSPSNVLLTDRGEVKLLDFGIARVSGDAGSPSQGRSRIRGKVPYMPVETFKGVEPTVQSDVYSAGVVLYELLTGSNPFAASDTAKSYDKILGLTLPSVHAARDDAPEDVDAVLARALDRDPKRRYASAAEFAQALRGLRRQSDEAVSEELASQLHRDFAGPMPEALGLEPLSAREATWRGDSSTDADVEPRLSMPTVRPAQSVHQAATVPISMDPGALPEAALPTPLPPPSSPQLSVRRIAWVAGLAASVGALVAGASWLALGLRAEPQVVVVERRMPAVAAAQPKVTEPLPVAVAESSAPAPSEPAAPEPAAPEPPASVPKAPSAKPAPPPPSPQALTRAFGRRQAKVEDCFAKHPATLGPSPHLRIHFRVAASGDVLEADLEPADVGGTPLGQCLLQTARRTYFGVQQHEVAFYIPITASKTE